VKQLEIIPIIFLWENLYLGAKSIVFWFYILYRRYKNSYYSSKLAYKDKSPQTIKLVKVKDFSPSFKIPRSPNWAPLKSNKILSYDVKHNEGNSSFDQHLKKSRSTKYLLIQNSLIFPIPNLIPLNSTSL